MQGSTWVPAGTVPDVTVQDVAWYNNEVVAATSWNEPVSGGSLERGRLYRIVGANWLPLSTQLDARIETIAPFKGSLYCAGPFISVAGKGSLGIARWDGHPAVVEAAAPAPVITSLAVTGLDPIPLAGAGAGVQIAYRIRVAGEASLSVFDVRGREIQSLVACTAAPGRFVVSWNRRDRSGATVPAGVYFVRLRTADRDYVRRLVMAR
jgi:hypothetical protein